MGMATTLVRYPKYLGIYPRKSPWCLPPSKWYEAHARSVYICPDCSDDSEPSACWIKWYENIEPTPRYVQWVAHGDRDEAAEQSGDEINDIFVADDVSVFGHQAVYFTIIIIICNHITMYDSFWMGVSFSYIVRLATLRMLRWPQTSGITTLK